MLLHSLLSLKVFIPLISIFPGSISVLQRLQNKDNTVTLDDIRSCNEAKGIVRILDTTSLLFHFSPLDAYRNIMILSFYKG